MSAGDIVGEPLSVHGLASGRERAERVAELFAQVGLRVDQMRNFPHQFSGGQRQRICIARALALKPDLIVCDEPVSALDVSIQAQVINLLVDLQRAHGFSYLFIAHDLAVVAHISHRVAVMYLGRIVEIADKSELFNNPRHPYTQALLASVPVADPRVRRLTPMVDGDVPSPVNPPSGCAFHTRCRYAMERCKTERPALVEAGSRHQVACLLNDGTIIRGGSIVYNHSLVQAFAAHGRIREPAVDAWLRASIISPVEGDPNNSCPRVRPNHRYARHWRHRHRVMDGTARHTGR
jgi:peptide/nickel transport system ATP-binding protein/oligopeptide transport system ATP-binding protein